VTYAPDWLAKLGHLKIDRSKGPAPHKPLLLLVVLELAEKGELPAELLPLSPALAFRFATFWTIVAHRRRQRPDVRLPFFHLQSDGVWQPLDERGEPATDRKRAIQAKLDPGFVAFACDPVAREQARRRLIARYFEPKERIELYALVGLPAPTEDEMAAEAQAERPGRLRGKGREARFRLDVVPAYGYTCALTGLRVTTIEGATIIDAAHIHQFAHSGNNELQNGIALCKNAHWLFDGGLWSLDDDYRVIVANERFDEDAPDQKPLAAYAGERIRLPKDEGLWPDRKHLAWHREKKLAGK
jgi:putative restriction endonuclease